MKNVDGISGDSKGAPTGYGARIFDRSLGRFVFSAASLSSPHRLGQVVAGAMATLVARDGRRREDLQLRPFVTEGSGYRAMSRSERSAMDAGFEQSAAPDAGGRGGLERV
jgi:hypothetical protein